MVHFIGLQLHHASIWSVLAVLMVTACAAAAEIDIYPRSRTEKLDADLFRNPTAEYRGTPFWSWNCKLDEQQLLGQIDQLKAMGFGGFHMHVRVGLATEYLGDEFMSLIQSCTRKAKRDHMLAWLYDEDRWPSGAAGGLVTKDPQYRIRHLLFTGTPYGGKKGEVANEMAARATRTENGSLLARYEVVLQDGHLVDYHRLSDSQQPSGNGKVWYAYLETTAPTPWYNNQTYVDTLSRKAIERFIAVTHQRYLGAVGSEFGKTIPAIFTDEPQFTEVKILPTPEATKDAIFPFTDDFPATYRKAYGQDLLDHLPELLWELPAGKASAVRYRYYDHVSERFAEAFADTLGNWCGEHNLAFTGHLMAEASLAYQIGFVGDAMRSYRGFQIPGVDMLCDAHEYTTAKQAQSAVHQYGRCGALSELYGVTNWDYDFVGHKAQGDWQAALGITVRVPHLAWVSMAGEAKRDYPAAIGWQSPWYKEYPLVEDHFARLNTVLTRGRPGVRVGVIHPVESFWLCMGPPQQTKSERDRLESAFQNVTQWLLFGQVDFNFICEGNLPEQCPNQEGPRFNVGKMAYDVVVVPSLRTVRASTLKRLEKFVDAGGKVVFAGEIPSLVDALPSDRAEKLAQRCAKIELDQSKLLGAVESARDLEIRLADCKPADSILYQMRIDGPRRHIFFCNVDRKSSKPGTIRIKGDWDVEYLDTMTGRVQRLASQRQGDSTVIDWTFTPHGHLLITLEPGWRPGGVAIGQKQYEPLSTLNGPVPVTLSEPNVVLFDQAEWRWNDGAWKPKEEILRLDDAVRKQIGIPKRGGGMAQPWTDHEPVVELGKLQLKFTFRSDVNVSGAQLAMEEIERAEIRLDGAPVPSRRIGWWVDESIHTIALPSILPGQHEILITIPFTRKCNVEWTYLLGDFGVKLQGRDSTLIPPVKTLALGDWTPQGLPFYAGNITYHFPLQAANRSMTLEASAFKSPLLSVAIDGQKIGRIAFAPYRAELGILPPGPHTLDITAYGNRFNAFGCLHQTDTKLRWVGPNAWRSTGKTWSYDYILKPMGILAPPQLLVEK